MGDCASRWWEQTWAGTSLLKTCPGDWEAICWAEQCCLAAGLSMHYTQAAW